MKLFKMVVITLLVLSFVGSGLVLTAQEPSKEEQEMMKKMMEYATPGANHKYLENFVGKWNAVTKMWEKPGAPPAESQQEVKMKMIMGGRYLKFGVKGTLMGMTFEGMMITGYDNFKKKLISVWIDSMGTGIYMTEGTFDQSGKIRTETGVWDDMFTGGTTKVKMVYKIVDKDKILFEMYTSGGMYGDKEFKNMEATYTRVK
jgi:hypothetical protein